MEILSKEEVVIEEVGAGGREHNPTNIAPERCEYPNSTNLIKGFKIACSYTCKQQKLLSPCKHCRDAMDEWDDNWNVGVPDIVEDLCTCYKDKKPIIKKVSRTEYLFIANLTGETMEVDGFEIPSEKLRKNINYKNFITNIIKNQFNPTSDLGRGIYYIYDPEKLTEKENEIISKNGNISLIKKGDVSTLNIGNLDPYHFWYEFNCEEKDI